MNKKSSCYEECCGMAKQSLPYGLDEAERAVYKVLWAYHDITPDVKQVIHRSIIEYITKTLIEDNGGYPLSIEGV